ncbi:hypothetical protein BU23DRAFT_657261 [Bimuria novae-zelandiae CBS 107.79]|uniref:Nudix hydrolase domain-containing protein n=1 Tax=Bimuria novae-zelandiae CBS 107.79 TaxID=1447943 RepID=A0A6A5VLS2_9PLEO|nr:hypothetical protein BU23DRAFT_657261 [Bimuria novae-zelandiae CBS 107.79]
MATPIKSMLQLTPAFKISHSYSHHIPPRLLTRHDPSTICTTVFALLINTIIDNDLLEIVHAQYSELVELPSASYPVHIKRFATPLVGILSRGAHLTAYTRSPGGEMKIWVPRRSAHLKTFPNKLDSTVAGGVKAGDSPFETIIHEADEEASLSEALLRRDVRACETLSYIGVTGENDLGEKGLVVPDVVYVYDIELSEEVVPRPKDNEVKEFYLMGVEEVRAALRKGEFKTNSAVVMINFFIRHRIVTEQNEDGFEEICRRMHSRLPFEFENNV